MSDLGTSPARLWRKICWRILPVVSIAWLCSAVDRGSLGYVAVPLSSDLGLSATNIGYALPAGPDQRSVTSAHKLGKPHAPSSRVWYPSWLVGETARKVV
jgi:hypothetical protein